MVDQRFGTENESLWNLGFETIKELETDLGILASGKEEIYGCIFGRDSLITSLKLLRVYEHTHDEYFAHLVRKILATLSDLQGKNVNIESGEEPGKCIHEYRPNNHEHLTKNLAKPWYVYGDNIMRNYDSVDSTPLFLIAAYRYSQLTGDTTFVETYESNIKAALNWILEYGDSNGDGFLDYGLNPERKHGGLATQSWMDSVESVFHEDGTPVTFPVAPVEAQSYAFLALKLWSRFFSEKDEALSKRLSHEATTLKYAFNKAYVIRDTQGVYLAAGVDGNGKAMRSVRSTMGHCLWASLEENKDGITESIVEDAFIPDIVARLMEPDLFEPRAGIRTLSTLSRCYSPNSYHNGSIWPHDTSIVASGLDIFGYYDESSQIRTAILSALSHFNTPIELFVFDTTYSEYSSKSGQGACKKQAWAAASLLRDVATFRPVTQ